MFGRVKCPFCFRNRRPVSCASDKSKLKCSNPECECNKKDIPFPAEVFTHELFPIAIVGPSSSGKTYYLTALMNEFVNNNTPWSGSGNFWNLDVVHYAADSMHEGETNKFIQHWRNLFINQSSLGTTQENEWLPPLLLSVEKAWSVKEPLRRRKLLLAFHDVPGEFTTNDNTRMALSKRYGALGAAKGIIVLVEPTEIPLVKSTLLNDGTILRTNDKASALEAIKGLRQARQARKPVAICLSKSDLLLGSRKIFPMESHLSQYEQTDFQFSGKISFGDVQETSDQVRDTFEQFNAGDYLPLMSNSFKYYSFFAVSALGRNVINSRENKILSKPKPIRVLDPILWILWQWGHLEGE